MNLRIFGPPGTGKTYALTQIVGHLTGRLDVSDWLDDYGLDLPRGAYSPRDVALMSFTNSAVDELLSRVGLRRGYSTGLFGTMHGIALHLLMEDRLISKKVVSNTLRKPGAVSWWKAKFAREVGIPYDPNEELTTLPGNQFFNAYTYAVNVYFLRYLSLGRVIDRLMAENDEWGTLAEQWLKFKRREKIFDFDDILALTLMADTVPHVEVLIADEFQDFSPLQWEIFKNWMVDTEYVIISGDDDQALFRFQGASPDFLLHEFPADETVVLKRSFRLPSQVLLASQLLVRLFVRNRYPKKFQPRIAGGRVLMRDIEFANIPDNALYLARKGFSVMVLARTNSQVKDLEELFLRKGIPFYRFKTRRMQVWKDFVDRLENFIRTLKERKAPLRSDARFYLKLLGLEGPKLDQAVEVLTSNPSNLLAEKIIRDPLGPLKPEKVAEALGSQSLAEVALEALRARLSGKMRKPAGKIYIDTIHSAKGREADVVFIYDSITPRIKMELEEGTREDFEAEVRVWYVALTRAREAVVIMRGPHPFLRPKLAQATVYAKQVIRR